MYVFAEAQMSLQRSLHILIIASACVAGCSSAPQAIEATEQEKDDAATAWISCLAASAEDMDDGISDASTVAVAVAAMCHSEFLASRETFSRGMNAPTRTMFERGAGDMEIENATIAVLKARAVD
jgi:hypothetical protein